MVYPIPPRDLLWFCLLLSPQLLALGPSDHADSIELKEQSAPQAETGWVQVIGVIRWTVWWRLSLIHIPIKYSRTAVGWHNQYFWDYMSFCCLPTEGTMAHLIKGHIIFAEFVTLKVIKVSLNPHSFLWVKALAGPQRVLIREEVEREWKQSICVMTNDFSGTRSSDHVVRSMPL